MGCVFATLSSGKPQNGLYLVYRKMCRQRATPCMTPVSLVQQVLSCNLIAGSYNVVVKLATICTKRMFLGMSLRMPELQALTHRKPKATTRTGRLMWIRVRVSARTAGRDIILKSVHTV
jgi:hypothetical protein